MVKQIKITNRMEKIKIFLKSIQNKLIFKEHITSLGAISIALITEIILKIEINWKCLIIIFLGAEIIYLYNFNKDSSVNLKHTKYFQKYIPLFICLLILLFTTILITLYRIDLLIFGLLLIFLGLLYNIFLKNLTRNIIGFKNFFVSFCWATIVIFVSLFSYYYYAPSVFLIFVFVLISVFIQEVILDIKDVGEDKKLNLLTLPLFLDKKTLFLILISLTILTNIPIFYGVYFHLLPTYSLVLSVTTFYNFFIFKNIYIFKNLKFIEFFVDGEKILWSILILIFYKL